MIMMVVKDLGKEILAVSEGDPGSHIVQSCMTAVRGVWGPTGTLSIMIKWHARHEKGWLPFNTSRNHFT